MDLAPLLTFGGAVLTAIITVLGTVYVSRSKTKTDLGASITSGFKDLTDQLQEERNHLGDIIKTQRGELEAAEKEFNELDLTIRKLRRHLILLERQLERAGQDVPPHDLY